MQERNFFAITIKKHRRVYSYHRTNKVKNEGSSMG
jgi:hypothetical protein